jgi:ribosome-binding protein aMBF1 (putative translation factor)
MGPNRRAQERERAAARAAARAKRAEAERKAVADGLHLRLALASNVRRIRQAQGLTQVGFAHEAGMDRSYVSRLGNGNFDEWPAPARRVLPQPNRCHRNFTKVKNQVGTITSEPLRFPQP